MKQILKKVSKLTNNKWINLYCAEYNFKNKQINYEFASRNKSDNLVINGKKSIANAVRILPYFVKDNETFVVLINEFRSPINKNVLGTPAGLVDENETYKETAIRETFEEIGGKVLKLEQTNYLGYSSAGLTDESIVCFDAEVELTNEQHLEDTEDIELKIVNIKEIKKLVETQEFCLQSALQLLAFYYKKLGEK